MQINGEFFTVLQCTTIKHQLECQDFNFTYKNILTLRKEKKKKQHFERDKYEINLMLEHTFYNLLIKINLIAPASTSTAFPLVRD